MQEKKNSKSRRVIYVDASFNNETKEAKIGLYDKEDSRLDSLLVKKVTNSGEAEKYAVLYACIYSKRKNITDRKIHILNDNYHVTQDEQIRKICQYFDIGISWIPREINAIADKGTKLAINIKEEESHLLSLFYDIMVEQNFTPTQISSTPQETLEPLLHELFLLKGDILHNALRILLAQSKTKQTSIGAFGKYLKDNYPHLNYNSPKKELEKYPEIFTIINQNHVKLK